MSDSISTYWAKNVKIKAYRGNNFEFALNVKNDDGSDYIFPSGHEAFFAVYNRTYNGVGTPLFQAGENSDIVYTNFQTSIEDGKITISNTAPLLPLSGTYHYILFTYDPENYGINLQEVQDDLTPPNMLRVGFQPVSEYPFLYMDSSFEAPEGHYYHEWYHLPGDDDLELMSEEDFLVDSYCINPDWAWVKANTEVGQNLYQEHIPAGSFSDLSSFLYTYGFDYSDASEVWNNDDTLTYKQGMERIDIRVGVQQKNITACLFTPPPEALLFHTIYVMGVPIQTSYSSSDIDALSEDIEMSQNFSASVSNSIIQLNPGGPSPFPYSGLFQVFTQPFLPELVDSSNLSDTTVWYPPVDETEPYSTDWQTIFFNGLPHPFLSSDAAATISSGLISNGFYDQVLPQLPDMVIPSETFNVGSFEYLTMPATTYMSDYGWAMGGGTAYQEMTWIGYVTNEITNVSYNEQSAGEFIGAIPGIDLEPYSFLNDPPSWGNVSVYQVQPYLNSACRIRLKGKIALAGGFSSVYNTEEQTCTLEYRLVTPDETEIYGSDSIEVSFEWLSVIGFFQGIKNFDTVVDYGPILAAVPAGSDFKFQYKIDGLKHMPDYTLEEGGSFSGSYLGEWAENNDIIIDEKNIGQVGSTDSITPEGYMYTQEIDDESDLFTGSWFRGRSGPSSLTLQLQIVLKNFLNVQAGQIAGAESIEGYTGINSRLTFGPVDTITNLSIQAENASTGDTTVVMLQYIDPETNLQIQSTTYPLQWAHLDEFNMPGFQYWEKDETVVLQIMLGSFEFSDGDWIQFKAITDPITPRQISTLNSNGNNPLVPTTPLTLSEGYTNAISPTFVWASDYAVYETADVEVETGNEVTTVEDTWTYSMHSIFIKGVETINSAWTVVTYPSVTPITTIPSAVNITDADFEEFTLTAVNHSSQETPPETEFGQFRYDFELIKAETGQVIWGWSRNISLNSSVDENEETTFNLSGAFMSESINLFGDDFLASQLLDGDELKIRVKPELYRKWDNTKEGFIRLTGTFINTHWYNNSYISYDSTIPVEADYWLYGDFIIK